MNRRSNQFDLSSDEDDLLFFGPKIEIECGFCKNMTDDSEAIACTRNNMMICKRCANSCSINCEHRINIPVSGFYMCFSCEFIDEKKSKG